MVIIRYSLLNFQPGKVNIINSSPCHFAPHCLNLPQFLGLFLLFLSIEKKMVTAAAAAAATCTSELQQQGERCLGLYSRGMEVNRASEVLASHRQAGQKGHSSLRIPSVVSYRPQFVSQSARRLLRKCSLSSGSLGFHPVLLISAVTQTTRGL